MTKKQSLLQIHDLSLSVNLGWRQKERWQEQTVLLDLDISFAKSPKACESDQLADTVCYDALIKKIHAAIRKKNYCLLEHLCYEIYHIAADHLPSKTKIMIGVRKFPRIEGLKGGARFCYGDHFSSW